MDKKSLFKTTSESGKPIYALLCLGDYSLPLNRAHTGNAALGELWVLDCSQLSGVYRAISRLGFLVTASTFNQSMDLDAAYFNSLASLLRGDQKASIGFKAKHNRDSVFDEEYREFVVQSEVGAKKICVGLN